jgi:hypothetical protein
MLPPVLASLGASDSAARSLAGAGVLEDGPTLTTAFRDSVRDVLASAGVDVDAAVPAAQWDAVRRRGPGQPDADTVERARGDRNRMLFVE